MAIAITFPKYSFVVKSDDDYTLPDCSQLPHMCLPLSSFTNIRFQFNVSGLELLTGDQKRHFFFYPIPADADCDLRELEVDVTPANSIFEYDSIAVGDETERFIWITGINKSSSVLNYIDRNIGGCFRIIIIESIVEGDNRVSTAIGCTNCFMAVRNDCYLSVLGYYSNEDGMTFRYQKDNGNPINELINKIELPLYLKNMQPVIESGSYMRSDGSRKKLFSRIYKEWELETDYMPQVWHDKLNIALQHDYVNLWNMWQSSQDIDDTTAITIDEPYQIDWIKGKNHPYAKASTKVRSAEAESAYNMNCK